MARWEPDARGRLERAAMELYGERGFDHTTVADIAERAGVTERTFFRHYADKREVLFWGQEILRENVVAAVRSAPADATPMAAVAAGLDAFADVLDERRDLARRRQAVIAENSSLQERELIKLAALATAIAAALQSRGVCAADAALTAEAGIAVVKVAFERWLVTGDRMKLRTHLARAFADLRALTA